jgi:hypothetical protein
MTEQTKEPTVSNPIEAVVSAADVDILQEIYQSLERKGVEFQKTNKTKAKEYFYKADLVTRAKLALINQSKIESNIASAIGLLKAH